MPNNKTNSETSSIETKCRSCLTRTFTDPDLHARLKEEENFIKKNNSHRSRSLSFSSDFFNNTSAFVLQETNDEAFLPSTPFPTPNSSCNSIPIFYISSASSSERGSHEDMDSATRRRYTF